MVFVEHDAEAAAIPVAPESAPSTLDVESARWLDALSTTGSVHDAAVAELHALLLRIARTETYRRNGQLQLSGVELDDVCHHCAADAMLAILGKLTQFRGESRFTTWAYKFVIFEVSSKMGRHFWRNPPAPYDGDEWDRLPDRFGVDPAAHSESSDLARAIRDAVEQHLTEHQRRIFVALVLTGTPLDALTIELGSNRNAIYKTMFDARRKIRLALVANGYVDSEDGNTGSPAAGTTRPGNGGSPR